jgi:crotonobetainyl-CoA:carnitine CoA-transferase CaiB-like acyl-CoA transferase
MNVRSDFPAFGALQGVTVLDTGGVVAAPFACELAAECGAQVIRVELPTEDVVRGNPDAFRRGLLRESAWWAQEDRNKLGIVLDFSNPEGKEVFASLVKKSDIWIESSIPGTYSDHLGITDEWVHQLNPSLVIVHVSGYGQYGDPQYFKRASYDMIGQAFSGFLDMNGEPDGPPMKSNPYTNDYITSLWTLWSALAGYISAQRTGQGQSIDVAQFECQFKMLGDNAIDYLMFGHEHHRAGNFDPSGAHPYGVYPTKDGWLCIGAVGGPFQRLKKLVPALDQDKYQTMVDQITYGQEIREHLEAWLAERTSEEAELALNAVKVPSSRVMTMNDIATNPHYKARDMIIEWTDHVGGKVRGVGFAPKFSGTPGRVWRGAPDRGQDTEAVLIWAGYDAQQIDALRAGGAVE